jgi:hypothetical protein
MRWTAAWSSLKVANRLRIELLDDGSLPILHEAITTGVAGEPFRLFLLGGMMSFIRRRGLRHGRADDQT